MNFCKQFLDFDNFSILFCATVIVCWKVQKFFIWDFYIIKYNYWTLFKYFFERYFFLGGWFFFLSWVHCWRKFIHHSIYGYGRKEQVELYGKTICKVFKPIISRGELKKNGKSYKINLCSYNFNAYIIKLKRWGSI